MDHCQLCFHTQAKHHKNHQHLYTALYIKEIQEQWKREGYDISKNPDAVVTLFNIGFKKSLPNPQPVAGGAEIGLGGKTYTYGGLGAYFYYGDQLIDTFPR